MIISIYQTPFQHLLSTWHTPAGDRESSARYSGVIIYIDDILITGATEADHLHALEQVLDQLETATGLRIKKEKCQFMVH